MKMRTWATAMFLAAFATSGVAWAQDEEEGTSEAEGAEPEGAEEEAADGEPAEGEAAEEGEPAEEAKSGEDLEDTGAKESVEELPGKTYRFLGARYRGIIVPKFMQNLFAEGGDTVYVHAFGPEFAIRKDGFEYNLGLWLGLYHMDPTAFKGKDDEEIAWETVESKLNILYFTSDFLWSHPFTPALALNYGVGAGFGIVFGDLHRNQTVPADPNNPGDPNTWRKCRPEEKQVNLPYCDNDNDHYGDYTEPSWANGGSKPIIFPWLALQTGLRYKAHPKFVGRLDLGFGTSGFFFGVGADYGL